MSNVFVFPNGVQKTTGNLYFDVLSEDGVFFSQEVYESKEAAQEALGVTSKNRHEVYARYYPEGFEIVYVDPPDTHEGFQKAIAAHRALPVEEYAKKAAIIG